MFQVGDELLAKRNHDIADYYRELEQLNTKDLAEKIMEHVVGQDAFIYRFVPQFIAMMSRMMLAIEGKDESELPRLSSACVIGPTASGKTHFFKTLSKVSGVPMQMVDCASLTGAGWKGGDIEGELVKVAALQEMYPCVPMMIVWDEADKMRHEDSHLDRSSSAQQTFLKYLDGGTYSFAYGDKSYSVDTRFIINIFLGAFTGIEDIVKKRLCTAPSFGFATSLDADAVVEECDWREQVCVDDLQEWGMFKEFCGRIGPIESIPALGVKDLIHIISGCEHSLVRKFESLLPADCALEVTDAAATVLAQKALESSLGVRALESHFQRVAIQAIDEATRIGAANVVIDAKDNELFYKVNDSFNKESNVEESSERKSQFHSALESELEQQAVRLRQKKLGSAATYSQSRDAINEQFQRIYFDLSYFLGADLGPERIAKCLVAECTYGVQEVPRAFCGSYKETCFTLLLHLLCKYDRKCWTFGELYHLACLSHNREEFNKLFDEASSEERTIAGPEKHGHISLAKKLMQELERVSPEAFWREAGSLEKMLSACKYRYDYAEAIAQRIQKEFPPGRSMPAGNPVELQQRKGRLSEMDNSM